MIDKITFVILTFMLVGDFLVEIKEGWKKGIRSVFGQDRSRMFGNKQRHVRKGHGESVRVIKLDEITFRVIRNQRIKWNIHTVPERRILVVG